MPSYNNVIYVNRKLVDESHLIDFESDLPRSSLSYEEKKKIWSDNLHLSAAGYDLMAEIIYRKLKLALSSHLEKK
jgi:lysophospholipase L1-like esterase